MDIKQLKINGVAFYPKVPVEAIVSVDGDTGAVDTTVQQNSDNLVTSGAVYTAIQGKSTTWTDVQGKPNFATVATSGSYNDLTDKPTIPSAMSVDDALNANSTNPVQNKVVNGAIGGLQQSISGVLSQLNNKLSSGDLKTVNGQSLVGSGDITITPGSDVTVDDALSTTSTNPVQNKIVAGEIANLQYQITETADDLFNYYYTKTSTDDLLAAKQAVLVSGTNIKTINGQTILGNGDITISGGGSTIEDYLKSISLNGTAITVMDSHGAAVAWEVNSPTITFAVADDNQTPGGTIQLNQRNDATIYLPAAVAGGTASVKSLKLDDNGTVALTGTGSVYIQGLDGIQTKENGGTIQLYLSDQFKTDMQSALETAAQSLLDVGDLEERVAALEAIEPGDGGTSPSIYLKSITKNGNTYTIKDQANTETSWTIPTIPTIPTVNNSTVTFAIADAEHPAGGSFTLNQATSATIYLPASTGEGGTTYIENPFEIARHSISELSDGNDLIDTVTNHSTAITAHDRQLYTTKEVEGLELTLSRIDLLEQALADLTIVSALNDLSDVDTTGTKNDGYILTYNQSNSTWVPAAPFGGSLGSLSNVTITSPAEGQVLKFTGQKWENGTIAFSGVTSIKVNESNTVSANSNGVADISYAMTGYQTKLKSTDTIGTINNQELKYGGSITIPTGSGDENVIETIKVNGTALTPDSNKVVDITVPNLNISTATPTNGQVLKWNGTQWAPAADNASSSTINLNDINDVSAGDASDGQVLMYYAGDWLNRNIVLNEIGDVNTTGATEGQVLKYNGNKWVPAADNAGSSTTVTPSVKTFDVNVSSLNSYKVSGEEKFKYFSLIFPLDANYNSDCEYPVRIDVQYFSTNYDRTDTAFGSFVVDGGIVFNSTTHYGWKNVYDTFNDGDTARISAGSNLHGTNVNVEYINPAQGVYEWRTYPNKYDMPNQQSCIAFPIGLNVEDYGNATIKVTVSGLSGNANVDVSYVNLSNDSDHALASIANKIS